MVKAGIPGGPGTCESRLFSSGALSGLLIWAAVLTQGRYITLHTGCFQVLPHCWACAEHLQPLSRSSCTIRWVCLRVPGMIPHLLSVPAPHRVSGRSSLTQEKSPLLTSHPSYLNSWVSQQEEHISKLWEQLLLKPHGLNLGFIDNTTTPPQGREGSNHSPKSIRPDVLSHFWLCPSFILLTIKFKNLTYGDIGS